MNSNRLRDECGTPSPQSSKLLPDDERMRLQAEAGTQPNTPRPVDPGAIHISTRDGDISYGFMDGMFARLLDLCDSVAERYGLSRDRGDPLTGNQNTHQIERISGGDRNGFVRSRQFPHGPNRLHGHR